MVIMENMSEDEMKEMHQAFKDKISQKNEEATFSPFKIPTYKMREIEKLEDKVNDLSIRVSQLEHFIKTIFDGHVLIDGQWKKIIL